MRKTKLTTEQLVKLGGNEWTGNNGVTRVYMNGLSGLYGLEYGLYKTNNVSWARLNGEKISNRRAQSLVFQFTHGKLWVEGRHFHWKEMADEVAGTIIDAIESRAAEVQE